MTQQHTNGPWHVKKDINGNLCVDDVDSFGKEYKPEFPIAIIQGPLNDKQANAALIAAAPDLFEALNESITVMISEYNRRADKSAPNYLDPYMPILLGKINSAKAAIAKAEGR